MNKICCTYIKQNPRALFGVTLVITTLVTIVISMVCPIRFDDNDDITYAWIASGVYSGQPDCHLVFLNALYGKMVAGLYSLLPSIEWYTILFLIFLCASTAAIAYVICRKINQRWLRISLLCLLFVLLFYNLICLQFTKIAAIVAFAGIVLLCDQSFIYGGILLLIGSLIRFEAAGLVGLLMIPALCNAFQWNWRKGWLPLALILSVVMGFKYADKFFYQTPEWSTFHTCSRLTAGGKINDNPHCWRVRQDLPPSVSITNFDCITAFAPDPEQATVERLAAINEKIAQISLQKKAKNVYLTLLPKYWMWFLLIGIIGCAAVRGDNKKRILWIASCLIFWIALLSMISINATVKFRVFFASLLPILFYIIYCVADTNLAKWQKIMVSSLLVILMGWGFVVPIFQQLRSTCKHDLIINEQLALYKQRGDLMVVTDGPDLRVEYLDAFHLKDAIPPHSFINPYCFSGCPLTPEYMSYRDFVDGQLCLFSSKPINVDLRQKALKEDYGILVAGRIIAESEHYVLVKLVRIEEN